MTGEAESGNGERRSQDRQFGELRAEVRALRDELRGLRADMRDSLRGIQERLDEHEKDDQRRLGSLERWRSLLAGGGAVIIFLLGMIVSAWPWQGWVR